MNRMDHITPYCHYVIIVVFLLLGVAMVSTDEGNDAAWKDIDDFLGYKSLPTNKNYLFVGERLIANCTLTEDGGDDDLVQGLGAQSISFQRQSLNEYPGSSTCFNQSDSNSNVRVLNSRTAILNISVTTKLAGIYNCYRAPLCSGTPFSVSDDISVQYPPKEVTNFSCVAFNWVESMKCIWDFPVNYTEPINTKVYLSYKPRSGTMTPCQDQTFRSCVWKKFLFSSYYTILVKVINTVNNATVQSSFPITPQKLVKPGPVVGLEVKPSPGRKGCLRLTWTPSRKDWTYLFYRIKVQRISHKNGQNETFKMLEDRLEKTTTYEACRLGAYIHLNFSVEAHPLPPFGGFWSNPVYNATWTPQEVTSEGPPITPGSFVFINSSDTHSSDITFYWNQVPDTMKNGVIDSYIIHITSAVAEGNTEREVVVPNASLSVTLPVSLDAMTHPIVVNISAQNGAGISKSPTSWKINPQFIKVPDFIQNSFRAKIMSSSVLMLTWDHDKRTEYDYYVYWCYSPKLGKCEKPLHWRKLIKSSSQFTITGLKEPPNLYSYGLSTTTLDSSTSSGIFWTNCLTRDFPPTPLQFKAYALIKSILVSWESQTCSYHSNYFVKNYLVSWCVQSECEDLTNSSNVYSQVIPSHHVSYTIKEAQAGIEYHVSVKVVSDDFQRAELLWKNVVPLEKERVSQYLPAIVVIAVVFLIILCMVLLLLRRKFKKRKQTIDEKVTNLDLRLTKNISNSSGSSPSVASSPSSLPSDGYHGYGDSISGETQLTTWSIISGHGSGGSCEASIVPTPPDMPCPLLPVSVRKETLPYDSTKNSMSSNLGEPYCVIGTSLVLLDVNTKTYDGGQQTNLDFGQSSDDPNCSSTSSNTQSSRSTVNGNLQLQTGEYSQVSHSRFAEENNATENEFEFTYPDFENSTMVNIDEFTTPDFELTPETPAVVGNSEYMPHTKFNNC